MHVFLMTALVFLPMAAGIVAFPLGRRSKDARDQMVLWVAAA